MKPDRVQRKPALAEEPPFARKDRVPDARLNDHDTGDSLRISEEREGCFASLQRQFPTGILANRLLAKSRIFQNVSRLLQNSILLRTVGWFLFKSGQLLTLASLLLNFGDRTNR